MHACIDMYAYVCMHVYINMDVCKCMRAGMYVYVCMYLYVRMHVCNYDVVLHELCGGIED